VVVGLRGGVGVGGIVVVVVVVVGVGMNAAVARHAGDLPAESELGDGGDRDGDVPVGGADAAVPERDGGGGHGV
jgi:hypothetical protein